MSETGSRGLLDTSVIIDFDQIDSAQLPDETAISAVTVAELAAGPHAARDATERAPPPGPPAMGGFPVGTRCQLIRKSHGRTAVSTPQSGKAAARAAAGSEIS